MEWEGGLPSHLLFSDVSENQRRSDRISQRELSQFTAEARRAIGLDGDLSVRITSSRELQELNRRFRRKNKPTDVLSFPAVMGGGGDIAIAREIAATNAAALGHSLTTELKILILHGLLHLAGFDHDSDNGEMTTRESELRQELGLPFGLIERTNQGLQVPRRLKPPRADKRTSRDAAQLKLAALKTGSSTKRGGRRA
jgi:probable rRNA maturation factor